MRLRENQGLRARRSAFTLMEMLVVVAIIVALAGIGGYYFLGQAEQARKSTAKTQARVLVQACETYALDHGGQFPQNLHALLARDDVGGPYLKSADALRDPWGREYQMQVTQSDTGIQVPDVFTTSPTDNMKIGSH